MNVCTHKTPRHGPISPRQLRNPELLRQRKHDIQQRQKPNGFHGRPAPFPVNVEARVVRCLALREPFDEPLPHGDLLIVSVLVYILLLHACRAFVFCMLECLHLHCVCVCMRLFAKICRQPRASRDVGADAVVESRCSTV